MNLESIAGLGMKYKIEEERVAFFFFFLIFYDTSITSANNVYITVLEASLWGQNQLIIGKMTEKNKRKKKKEKKNSFISANNL